MNRYYAELLDVTDDNEIIRYGYAFMAKNIFDAKMHALQVSRQMKVVPLSTVWRVNKEQYAWMVKGYALPTMIDMAAVDHEAA